VRKASSIGVLFCGYQCSPPITANGRLGKSLVGIKLFEDISVTLGIVFGYCLVRERKSTQTTITDEYMRLVAANR
jgi:hypothetical protein